ncbi:MAG: hypothetical protein AAGA30_18145, partial [Planctomycetota bacterium]
MTENQENVDGTQPTEKKRRRRTSKKVKAQRQNRLAIRFFIILGLIVGGLFAGYLILVPKVDEDSLDGNPKESLAADANTDTFEDLLENGDSKSLLKEIRNLPDNPLLELPVRLDHINKRMLLANNIIDLASDPESVAEAKRTKLDAMVQKVVLGIENDIPNNTDLGDLSLLAESLAFDESLDKSVRPAKLVGNIARFLSSAKESDARKRYQDLAIAQFDLMGRAYPDDREVADKLVELAYLVHDKTEFIESRKFLATLSSSL